MKFSTITFFFISLAFLNNIYINSFISLNFTYINKKTGKPIISSGSAEEYLESLITNPIYTNLTVNNKEIQFHITMDRFLSYISEKTLKKIDPIAADEKNEKGNLYSLDYVGISRAVYTNSSFSFHANGSEDMNSFKLSFFMSKKMINDTKEIKEYCYASENEEIGFNINRGNKLSKVVVEYNPEDDDYREDDDYYDYSTDDQEDKEPKILKNDGYYMEESTNLITQLKAQKLISSYAFFIKYNKNNESGQIIIGSLPHQYDSNNFKEDYYSANYIDIDDDDLPNWKKKFDSIKYGVTDINSFYKKVEFSIDSGFILTSKANKDFFDEKFFKNEKYKNYCNEELIGNYYIKYCKESVIKEFKNLTFNFVSLQNDNLEKLEFDYKDLFIKPNENDDRYYFQIVFQTGYIQWVLGRPLFKKYQMVFDQNKKIFGFYNQTGNGNGNDDEKDDKISTAWILVIILGIILVFIIGVGVFCFLKYKSENRKKKANELLDDNYEYNPSGENKEQDGKIN